MRALLHQREFRLLFAGHAISRFGDGMINVALAFAVLGVGGSASAVGLVFAARMFPLVACLLAGGVVADRTSRRGVMVAADLVRFASHGAMAALLISGGAEVWSLALLAGTAGAATGFFEPAATGLLPAVVDPADLQRANGMRATAMAFGEIAGPVVAGVLVATAGAGWALGIDAATFGLSALLLFRMRLRAAEPRERARFLADLREGWQAFRSRRWVWTLVASAAAANVFWGAWTALGPVVAERELGGATAWGAVLGAMGAGGLIGGIVAIRADVARPLLVWAVGAAIFPLPLAFLAVGAPVVPLAAAAFVAGVVMMLGNSLWESTLQRNVPIGELSRVSSYDWFGSFALKPVGLALWGPAAAAIGMSGALWIAFALLTLSGLVLLAVPEIRTMTNR